MTIRKRIRSIIPFVIAGLVIAYFMPREGKFEYEFQKGKPWEHESLVAPFDFPIYKTESECANERRNILKSFIPYYNYDPVVHPTQEANIEVEFAELLRKNTSMGLDRAQKDQLERRMLPLLKKYLEVVYRKGIREANSVADSHLEDDHAQVAIVENNEARLFPVSETFSPLSANQYISAQLLQQVGPRSKEYEFCQSLGIAQFIKPNLRYNKRLSSLHQEDRLAKVSPTRGMVREGQKIISKGDMVTESSYKILNSYRREYEQRIGYSGSLWLLVLGQVLLCGIFMITIYLYIHLLYKSDIRLRDVIFILSLICLLFLVTVWLVRSNMASIYAIPYALIPLLLYSFYDIRMAIFIHLVTVILIASIVPNSYEFCLLTTFAGVASIYSVKDVYRRGKLYQALAATFITYSFTYTARVMVMEGTLRLLTWQPYFWFAINAVLIMTAYQLTYIFEKMFGFTSDGTLMELSDTNQPLLRELAETAPATFQHSLQVANLAEGAVRQIGGNPLLVRAGALYHDIGKMLRPSFFIENQSSGFTPHTGLSAEESAKAIIQHVPDGVGIARKHRLPEILVDFILTHHGRAQTRYFSKIYKEQHPEATDFSLFTYPGPNPRSKEQGVLMLADSVEAASRGLTRHTKETIDNLVEQVVANVINDKLLDQSNLTFGDINTIKNVFKAKLQNVYHERMVDTSTPA